jgi:uncharacterized protein
MRALKKYPVITSLLLLTACVTINVYFPAAAAESAADKIIEEVYGEDNVLDENVGSPAEDVQSNSRKVESNFLISFLQSIIPAAQAQQPDINISSPGINKLKSSMKQHHKKLAQYYENGSVGMESNGLITIRDAKSIPLKKRNLVKKLVSDENRARTQLYEEIATANGHPEWKVDIRKTFARRWIARAPAGWWYIDTNGKWQKK